MGVEEENCAPPVEALGAQLPRGDEQQASPIRIEEPVEGLRGLPVADQDEGAALPGPPRVLLGAEDERLLPEHGGLPYWLRPEDPEAS
ncbi:hypothetical protein [Pyrodictium abyssi]|uniref:hypothetical protein n=1 Tax=Pyrodictium abyssi TaxID=54256 RepID=UPI0030C68883